METKKHNSAAASIKESLSEYFRELPKIFAESGGKDLLVRHTRKIDSILIEACKAAYIEMFEDYMPMRNTIPFVVCGLGSYGREQLCIHSDIDLMFVYKNLPGFNMTGLIEKILYILWDAGLKLGHRVHEVGDLADAASGDITIKTAMLESRFIYGSRHLWTETGNALSQIRKDDPYGFIDGKISERQRISAKYPLTMEPDIKDGKGGFRDANLVFWLGKVLYNTPRIKDLPGSIVNEDDYREFRISLEFLFRVRCALHIAGGKKTDRLRLDLLPETAKLLKYEDGSAGRMRLARKISRDLKRVYLYSTIWTEKMLRGVKSHTRYDKFFLPEDISKKNSLRELIESMNARASRGPFEAHPALLEALLHSMRAERSMDENLYRSIFASFACESSYSVMKTLSDAGLLGFVIPSMKKVTNLPQFDGFHRYSVDEHSLESLKSLENIEDDLLVDIFERLDDKEKQMLKAATLLHDAGKGRKKDHRLVGASLFRVFGKKTGMDHSLVEMGEKLIQYHTLMSTTAQREDLYSEKVIMRFASRFGNEKMLDMIYLLTYADMKGVGSGIYNEFTSKLLYTLYIESKKALRQDKMLDETSRRENKIESLMRSRSFGSLSPKLQKKILSIPSNAFFIRNGTKKIIEIAKSADESDDHKYSISNDGYLNIEIVRRRDLDLSYLLATLKRVQVASMSIFKLFDGLKYFRIEFDKTIDEEDMFFLEKTIKTALSSGEKPAMGLKKPIIEKDEISIDCEHSREYATMTLRTKDQAGLLAYLIYIFDELGVDIASAKIHTIKGRVNDLFLIEKNGNFCHNIELIVQKLTERICVE